MTNRPGSTGYRVKPIFQRPPGADGPGRIAALRAEGDIAGNLVGADLMVSLRRLGLLAPDESATVAALTGGVSSDILLVEAPPRTFCIKRALSRLKVDAVWEAPIARNAAEAAWMRIVDEWLPGRVPCILGEDRDAGLFAMEYLPPAAFPVWKSRLLDGAIDAPFAGLVGACLGEVHRRSAGRSELAAAFAHDATFEAIRIEPYLRATARRHPDLALRLNEIADRTLSTRHVLVHGDVSPKNILQGARGPVFLDAECAWYGDPAFDLAFCLNHLLLKIARRPEWCRRYMACYEDLATGYLRHADWEDPSAVERRSATLLPALLLARVDGKSPVEYLDVGQQATVRQMARELLQAPPTSLADLLEAWATAWERGS